MRIFLLALLVCLPGMATERIIEFVSEVRINKDASIDVHESIKVQVEHAQIRRGIMREFPTHYTDRFGNSVNVRFSLQRVLLDGGPVRVQEKSERNGVVIKMGDADILVPLGVHTYELWYSTTRQLGFFENFDELYWNVTGNGWRLPIDSAKARITLAEPVKESALRVAGYTGYQGESNRDYKAVHIKDSNGDVTRVEFETTKALRENQGLTIAVGWPKGIVEAPTVSTKAMWFVKDNLGVGVLMAAFAFLVAWVLRVWRRVRQSNAPGTIVPLFNPPQALLPSEIRYLSRFGYDAQVLSSEVVNLAVLGHLTIQASEGRWRSRYSVTATAKARSGLTELQNMILDSLFAKSSTNQFDKADSAMVLLAQQVGAHLKTRVGTPNFIRNLVPAAVAAFISGACIVAAVVLQVDKGPVFFVAIGAIVVMNILVFAKITVFTPKGRKLMDQVEGFKLFLTTAEVERMKIVGTPPTRTPELYERYLPYAIALGVESQWSRQFTPVFEALERDNRPYTPIWFVAPPGTRFESSSFGKSVNASLATAISSSSTAPGSSSGSGGGGSSGGGGGGGGGGGW